jgi:hypothetical protein
VSNPDVRESTVLLYCFVKIHHRLPHSTEIWRRRRLGAACRLLRPMVRLSRSSARPLTLCRCGA